MTGYSQHMAILLAPSDRANTQGTKRSRTILLTIPRQRSSGTEEGCAQRMFSKQREEDCKARRYQANGIFYYHEREQSGSI